MATAKQMGRKVGILVVLAGVACGQKVTVERPPGEPARLVNHILSLVSPADIKQRPEFAGTTWVVVEDSQTHQPSRSARFDNYVMTASDYTVGSVTGSLRMEFLNGMLLATWFYPSDYQKCLDELAATGVAFSDGASTDESLTVSDGDTTIRRGRDHEGRRYVAWEDRRLIEEMNKWLMRNS